MTRGIPFNTIIIIIQRNSTHPLASVGLTQAHPNNSVVINALALSAYQRHVIIS